MPVTIDDSANRVVVSENVIPHDARAWLSDNYLRAPVSLVAAAIAFAAGIGGQSGKEGVASRPGQQLRLNRFDGLDSTILVPNTRNCL